MRRGMSAVIGVVGVLGAVIPLSAADHSVAPGVSGSIRITLVKHSNFTAPSAFSVTMQRFGSVYSGATTRCLPSGSTAALTVDSDPASGATLADAKALGPCRAGGRAWRLLFVTSIKSSRAKRGPALLLRPE